MYRRKGTYDIHHFRIPLISELADNKPFPTASLQEESLIMWKDHIRITLPTVRQEEIYNFLIPEERTEKAWDVLEELPSG